MGLTKEDLRRLELKNMIKVEDLNFSNIEKHSNLNSLFFDENDRLKSDIIDRLLEIVDKFIDHIGLTEKELHIKDIVLTGSLANYNYSDKSDVDIHILSEYDKINENNELLTSFFKDKKDSWANKYDITVYKYPVELYVEDYETAINKDWVGMYSLLHKDWLQKPTPEKNQIDYQTLDKKSNDIAEKIDKIISAHSSKKISDKEALSDLNIIRSKIKTLRNSGFEKEHSEFAMENLIFKVLRNNGYFTKMDNLKKDIYDREYTIKENNNKNILIIKESQYDRLKLNLKNLKN